MGTLNHKNKNSHVSEWTSRRGKKPKEWIGTVASAPVQETGEGYGRMSNKARLHGGDGNDGKDRTNRQTE